MVANGDHVDMICGRNRKSNFAFEAKGRLQNENIDGIAAHIVNVPYAPQMGFVRRVLAFFSFAFWATVEGLRCEKPDIIFATSTPITVAIPGLIVSMIRRRPLVFEVRDIWPESAVATGVLKNRFLITLAKWFERFTYRRSKRIIALSQRMKERMIDATHTPHSKVEVIPIGADTDLFGGQRDDSFRQENSLEGDFLAVFPGAHGVANGLDVLVEAASLLPEGMRIVLIGEGARKQHLMARAKELGTDRILFFDPIPKSRLASILTCMDCGLMILNPLPVFETVLPNKMFDLASARLPIIVNFAGEVTDKVITTDAGIFIAENTPENMAAALIRLRDNEAERLRMAENARNLAEEYDRAKLAMQFHGVLQKTALLGQRV